MSYERLIREHDHIDAAARRVEEAAHADPLDAAVLVGLLGDLGCAVADHLSHEDRTVYGRLLEARKASTLRDPVDFEGLFQALRCDWQQYLDEWDGECIAADPDGFRSETTAIMARLRERVETETDLIYPLALRHGSIPLRDPRT